MKFSSFLAVVCSSLVFYGPLAQASEGSLPQRVLTIQSEGQKIDVEKIASGLNIPWGFDFLSDQLMIVTEKSGSMKILNLKTLKMTPVLGVPEVYDSGQGGLLDIKVHPKFKENSLVYFTYASEVKGGNTTRLAMARLNKNRLEQVKVLFSAQSPGTMGLHFGSRIAIDKDGFLFMGIGDRGQRERAQNLSEHGGKVIRLNLDGSVPSDNPFVGKKGALPEIWTYGHRNPQGIAVHPQTNQVWEQEHGPKGGDEINLLQKGANYGWPVITYGREYSGPAIGEGTAKKGMEQPLKYYVPSIAPSSLEFYTGDAFPAWKGNLFSGALVLTHLNRLVLKGDQVVKEERLLDDWGQRIRNVKTGPEGYFYFSIDQGEIYRLRPAKK